MDLPAATIRSTGNRSLFNRWETAPCQVRIRVGSASGDIILAVNKQPVLGMADFYRKVWSLGEAGVDVPLTILQGIQPRDLIVHSTVRIFNRQTPDLEKHAGDDVL